MQPNISRMTRAVAVCLLASQLSFPQVQQRTYTSKGKTIRYSVTVFAPPARITPDNGALNQDTALNCVRLYWSRLKNLDIKGAADVYLDPQAEIETRTKYRERVGEDVFREMHSKVFESNRFIGELVIGTQHALVSESNPGTLMLFSLRDRKFFIESFDARKASQAAQDLVTLVNAYGDGKLKFE